MSQDDNQKTNWLTLALCFIATVLEGLDLQSMGVAASGIVAEFNIQSSEMGLIASASSVGLLIGALYGGMISDKVGRKMVMITSVALFGICSLVTPFAWDANSLIAIRFITGLGMGGALPMIIAIAAEAVRPSQRAGAVTMMYCATPIGGFIAGAVVMMTDDWRQIFYVGGIAPLILVPVLIKFLAESDAFKNVQKAAPANDATQQSNKGLVFSLFGEKRAIPTFMLWIGFVSSVGILYLLLNWLPLLLEGKGFSKEEAGSVQLMFNVGGATGALLLGWFISKLNQRLVFGIVCLAIAGALLTLADLQHNITAAMFAGLVVGIFANGLVFLLYGQAGSYYPTAIRGTGVGWSVALGRMGAIIGPLAAGLLLSGDNDSSFVLMSILPIVLIAAIATQVLLSSPKPQD